MSERTKPESGGHPWLSTSSGLSSRPTSEALGANREIPLPPPTTPTEPPPRRRRALVAVVGAVLLLAIVVAVIMGTGSSSEPSASPSDPAEETTALPDLGAPSGLAADRAAFRIRLDWEGADGNVEMYRITRNGDVVGTVPAGRTRWLDTGVFPDSRYRYAIRAVDDFGVASKPATIAVRTPGAPLALARVQGLYNVTMITESKFGYGSFPSKDNTGWRFVPVCDEGACDVVWRDTTSPDLTARVERSGASYEGSGSGRFNSQCQGHRLMSTLTFRLHVTRAKVVGDTWRASALEGHLTQRQSAQLGCRPAGVDYTVRLVLYT